MAYRDAAGDAEGDDAAPGEVPTVELLCEGPVRNFEEAKATDSERFGKLHRAMLERGVYLAPSAFEAGFTSLAHSDADIDATLNAFRESFAAVA